MLLMLLRLACCEAMKWPRRLLDVLLLLLHHHLSSSLCEKRSQTGFPLHLLEEILMSTKIPTCCRGWLRAARLAANTAAFRPAELRGRREDVDDLPGPLWWIAATDCLSCCCRSAIQHQLLSLPPPVRDRLTKWVWQNYSETIWIHNVQKMNQWPSPFRNHEYS